MTMSQRYNELRRGGVGAQTAYRMARGLQPERSRLEERIPVLKPPVQIRSRVSITRSFSRKVNTGNYESVDFFCSQNVFCSPEEADEISTKVYEWCKGQVQREVRDFKSTHGLLPTNKAAIDNYKASQRKANGSVQP